MLQYVDIVNANKFYVVNNNTLTNLDFTENEK